MGYGRSRYRRGQGGGSCIETREKEWKRENLVKERGGGREEVRERRKKER